MAGNDKTKEDYSAKNMKRNHRGFIATLIGLGVVTLLLVIIAVVIKPIMTPEAQIQATAISATKTVAHKTGNYIDPELLIEPLPVENVSGIAVLGGVMALIILGVILREFILWRKKKRH